MLRQWFKLSSATLSLSPDGIALNSANQPAQALVSTQLNTTDMLLKAFAQALQHKALQTAGKRLRLILSNHFVRYSVLPWQPNINRREDWQAIALHDFRSRYGQVAEQWQTCVSLHGFSSSVVASAIDKALLAELKEISMQYGFVLDAIEPLLMGIIKQYQPTNHQEWLLIAEPERVLLCELNKQQWQRFSVISPPRGQESALAMQLVERTMNSAMPENRPAEIVYCAAPSVLNHLQSEQVVFKRMSNIAMPNQSSSVWLAGF